MKILLWFILLILCWPVAILLLFLYPLIWLLMLPFRLLGITVNALFDFIKALFRPPRTFGPQHRLTAAPLLLISALSSIINTLGRNNEFKIW